jgi:general nucleoside transport system permease protein
MGLLMAFISVTLKAEQGISGIGLYMFGLGLSSLLFKTMIGTVKTIEGFQALKVPLLGDIPYVGEIFFKQSLPVYAAFLLVPIAWFLLNKTTWGLNLRAVGQTPAAADSLGINVDRVRYVATCIGSMLAGLAGASFHWPWSTSFRRTLLQAKASSPSRWCTSAAGGRSASCWVLCCSAPSTRFSCGCRFSALTSRPTWPSCCPTC